MTVYHIISSFYPLIGGAERATENLCRSLVNQGCNVEVITRWYSGLRRSELIGGLHVKRMGLGGTGRIHSLFFGLHALFYLLLHNRSVSLVHVQNIDTPMIVGMLLKLLIRKPLIATIHSDRVIPEKQRTLFGRLRLHLMRKLVDHFAAVSKSGQEGMLRAGIPSDSVSLVPNGLDTTYFRPPTAEEKIALRIQYSYNEDDIIILFLGRLIATKRADLVLEALTDISVESRLKCVIVGDGPERTKLQALAIERGLDRKVQFIGATDKVRDFYWLSDIFVQPSQFEGLSVALLESMACGLIPLVSRCAGNLDAVKDNVNGLTFAVDNKEQLVEQLNVLTLNLSDFRVLGSIARISVQETYAIPIVAKAFLDLYQRLQRQSL